MDLRRWIRRWQMPLSGIVSGIVLALMLHACADKRPGDMAPDQTMWINKHLP